MPAHELQGAFVDVERDRNVVGKIGDQQAVFVAQDVADPERRFRRGQRGADEPCAAEDPRGRSELLDGRDDERGLPDPVPYLERDEQIVSHGTPPSQASLPRVRRPTAES